MSERLNSVDRSPFDRPPAWRAALAAVLLSSCGSATAGTAPSEPSGVDDPPSDTSSPSEAPPGAGLAARSADAVAPDDIPAACASGFQSCGGILAGEWTVEGTCYSEPTDRAALESWAQAELALDPDACANAVQGLSSQWSGTLIFDQGEAIDQRLRSDRVALELTPSCLAAKLGADFTVADLAPACAGLTSASVSCAAVDGPCRCVASREVSADVSGAYGVLQGQGQVAIGSTPQLVDYCIDGSLLSWRDPLSGQRLVLSRN